MKLHNACSYVFFLLVLLVAGFSHSFAHELQPSSLEVRQLTQDRYEVIWRAPIYYKKPHPARLQLPEHWQTMGEPTAKRLRDSVLHHRVVSVSDGDITGDEIRFIGLEATITDVFARFIWLDGTETTAIARPSQPWIDIIGKRSSWQVAGDYTGNFFYISAQYYPGGCHPGRDVGARPTGGSRYCLINYFSCQ